jgi:hypothetical protein
MTKHDITTRRLINQQIINSNFTKPEEILSHMCGMQAQDYAQAKWAIRLRLPESSDSNIEKAIAQKKIVRTWAMRGTLQFVAVKDYRWMLPLLAPQFLSTSGARNKQLGLNEKIFNQSNSLIVRALEESTMLTRDEIGTVLNNAGIATDQNRLSHLLHFATMSQLICFGPRKEKEFTFVLLDDWIPVKKSLSPEKSLHELAKRYFISRGPATLEDFNWWSGLSAADAKSALESVNSFFVRESFGGKKHYFAKDQTGFKNLADLKQRVLLLAGFDEYLIGYTDRSACLDPKFKTKAVYNNGIFHPTIVIDGQIVGIWRPITKGKNITMRSELFIKLTKEQKKKADEMFERYCRFAEG